MAKREMMNGNVAMAESALRGGADFFAGYPITPQSPFTEYLSTRMEELGREFVQAESEVSSVNMLLGASAAGARAITATAGMGFSLMQEGISWMSAGRLPGIFVQLQRGGAGASGGGPSQTDYNLCTKTLGHGGNHAYVLAPETVQEAADLMYEAPEFADKYRCIVLFLSDGMVAQVMEPVELKEFKKLEPRDYACCGKHGRDHNNMANQIMDWNLYGPPGNVVQEEMYKKWEEEELKLEEYYMDDAEVVLFAWGTAARIARGAIDNLREQGYKVGMLRPITLFPFPNKYLSELDPEKVKHLVVAEVAVPAQTFLDVDRAVKDRVPIHSFARAWGAIFSTEEVEEELKKYL